MKVVKSTQIIFALILVVDCYFLMDSHSHKCVIVLNVLLFWDFGNDIDRGRSHTPHGILRENSEGVNQVEVIERKIDATSVDDWRQTFYQEKKKQLKEKMERTFSFFSNSPFFRRGIIELTIY